MLFPAQERGSERHPMLLFGWSRRRQSAPFAERHQIGAVCLRARPRGVEGKMNDPPWHRDRRERPGMNFTQDCSTQRMGRKTRRFAVANQDLRSHFAFSIVTVRST